MKKIDESALDEIVISKKTAPEEYNDEPNPDARRIEKEKSEDHKTRMWLKRLYRFIWFFGVFVGFVGFIFIVFLIMPFSEISLTDDIHWFVSYSQAFVSALGTVGIAFLTIVATNLLSAVYKFIKREAGRKKESDQ